MSSGYVMIPVRPATKKMVDEYKERNSAPSYDEAIALAFRPKTAWEILGPAYGIFKDRHFEPFVRDKSERDLSRFVGNHKRAGRKPKS